MIYFQVQNTKGKIISGNMGDFSLKNNFEKNRNCVFKNQKTHIKSFCKTIDDISVWVLVQDDENLLKSSKLFNKTFEIYKKIALDVYEQYKKEIDAYAHTLNTIQAQINQKIDDFTPQDSFYGDTYKESITKIEKIIDINKTNASDLICYVQKRISDMKAQLLCSDVIHFGDQYEIKLTTVSLKRAILNQCTPFLEEFDKNSIKIRFYFDDDCKVMVDKNMFSLIMYNFLSNASKYILPNSEIRLNFSNDDKNDLDISMMSLKMDKDELSELHKDGVRGNYAKKFPGKGIGLYVIDMALKLMNKESMYISPNYEVCVRNNNFVYIENHFKFSL